MGIVNIVAKELSSEDMEITLINVLGKFIMRESVISSINYGRTQLDLTNISTGVYYLVVTCQDKRQNLIIQKLQ